MFRKITINKVLNGFVVEVGCQALVFETAAQFAAAFMEYAANPQKVEEEWLKRYGTEPYTMYAPTPLATQGGGAALHRDHWDATLAQPPEGRSR